MKLLNTLLLILSLVSCAQEKTDVQKLIDLTTDTERFEIMKSLMLIDILEVERDNFVDDYDSIVNKYYKDLEKYYKTNYTKEEIDKMLEFYNSPIGQKLAKDQRKLMQNALPPDFTLQQRIKNLKNEIYKKE